MKKKYLKKDFKKIYNYYICIFFRICTRYVNNYNVNNFFCGIYF